MTKFPLLVVLVFYGFTAQAAQAAQNDHTAAIERQWADNIFDLTALKAQYAGYCLESDYKMDQKDHQALCNLAADNLIESTLQRAVTLDQYIDSTKCPTEESYLNEYCSLGKDIKSRNVFDAIAASLCHMEPTLVEDDYHGGVVRRGDKIYNSTSLLFECDQNWFVNNYSQGEFTILADRIDYAEYLVLYETLRYSIRQDNEIEFTKQLNALSPIQLDAIGSRLLFDAVDAANIVYLEKLLSFGVNANNATHFFEQPLSEALSAGKDDAVAALLEHGASSNVFDRNGNSGLYLAVENCSLDTIKKLLEHGADIDGQLLNLGSVSESPLTKAAEFGRKDVVNYLLAEGAVVNPAETNSHSYSLLAQAARGGNEEIFNLLIDKGAKLTDSDKAMIMSAIDGGNVNILRTLFSMGIEIPDDDHGDILFKLSKSTKVRGNLDSYPYQQERQYQRPEQLALLVANGLNIEYKENGAHDYITRLTSRYRLPSETSNEIFRKYNAERLALTLTAIQVYSNIGLNLDHLESDSTLLMDATRGEYLDIVELLLRLGADKTITNKSGKTAKDLLGYSLSKTINDYPEKMEKIDYLKRIYFLLDGNLADLPTIKKRPPLSAKNLLRSFLKR